jgi:hypothetical protein
MEKLLLMAWDAVLSHDGGDGDMLGNLQGGSYEHNHPMS